ncbi:MAG: hypothetical protein AAFZ15_16880 [Bacteroidota bacterium]
MYRTTLIALACLIGSSLFAQQLTWMPEKGTKQENFLKNKSFLRSITCWDSDEMLVHNPSELFVMDVATAKIKANFSHNEIEKAKKGKYMDDLQTSQRRGAVVLSKTGGNYELTLVPVSAEGLGDPVNWCSFAGELAIRDKDLQDHIFVSDNREYVLLALPREGQMELRVFDAALQEVYRKDVPSTFELDGREFVYFEMDASVSDEGDLRLTCLLEDKKSSSRDWDKLGLVFLGYEYQQDQLHQHLVNLDQVAGNDKKAFNWPDNKKFLLGSYVTFNAPYGTIEGDELYEFGFNRETGSAIFAGLYKSLDGGGIFTVQHNFTKNELRPIKKHGLSDKIKANMLQEHFKGKTPKRPHLRISKILGKENGDFLVLADLIYEFKESGYWTYYSWDVIYQNIGPENQLAWQGNVSKKFRSKIMGSGAFAAMSSGDDVYFIFNHAERRGNSGLVGCMLKSDGSQQKLALRNTREDAVIIPVMPDEVPVQAAPLVAAGKFVKPLGTSGPTQLDRNTLLVFCVNEKRSKVLLLKIGEK